jgi:hypothetical protein
MQHSDTTGVIQKSLKFILYSLLYDEWTHGTSSFRLGYAVENVQFW